jgi:hypothetical protein
LTTEYKRGTDCFGIVEPPEGLLDPRFARHICVSFGKLRTVAIKPPITPATNEEIVTVQG